MGKGTSEDLKSCLTSIVISRLPDYELRRLTSEELHNVVESQREHWKKVECENEILQKYIDLMKIETYSENKNDSTSTSVTSGAKKQKRVSKHILSAAHKSKVYQAVIDEEKKKFNEKMQSLILNTENYDIAQTQKQEDLKDLTRRFTELDNLTDKNNPKNQIRGEEMLTFVNKITKRKARQLLKNLLQNRTLMSELHDQLNQIILKENENEYTPIDLERFSIEYQQLVERFNEKNEQLQKLKQRTSRIVPLMTIKKDKLRNIKSEYEIKQRELNDKERILFRLKLLCVQDNYEDVKPTTSKSSKCKEVKPDKRPTKRDFMAAQIVQKIINANNKELDNKIYLNKIHLAKVRQNKLLYLKKADRENDKKQRLTISTQLSYV